MHIVRFKMPSELVRKAIGVVSEKNPAKLANYHTFKLDKTVVSFVPGLKQAITDLDGDKGVNKFQHPCVVVLNRRSLWNS